MKASIRTILCSILLAFAGLAHAQVQPGTTPWVPITLPGLYLYQNLPVANITIGTMAITVDQGNLYWDGVSWVANPIAIYSSNGWGTAGQCYVSNGPGAVGSFQNICGAAGSISFTGDGLLITNNASTGSVHVTLGTVGVGYGVWGNPSGTSGGAPGYYSLSSYPAAAFPTVANAVNATTAGSATTAGTSTNLAGGAASELLLQTSPNNTGFTTPIPSATLAAIETSTAFTVTGTGCTVSSVTGSSFGGTFVAGSGPCTSVTITINGATGYGPAHDVVCDAGDRTQQNAGVWIPRWGVKATVITGTSAVLTLPIPGAASVGDEFEVKCDPT